MKVKCLQNVETYEKAVCHTVDHCVIQFCGSAGWNEITMFRINDSCIRECNVDMYGVKVSTCCSSAKH